MIDEVVGIAFRGFFRVLAWIFIELIVELAFYIIGYPFVKAFSLGRYPKHGLFEGAKTDESSEFFVSLVGFLVSAGFLLFLFRNSIFN